MNDVERMHIQARIAVLETKLNCLSDGAPLRYKVAIGEELKALRQALDLGEPFECAGLPRLMSDPAAVSTTPG